MGLEKASYSTTLFCLLTAGVLQCSSSPSRHTTTTIGLCPCNGSDGSVIVHIDSPPIADIFKKAEELFKELAIDKNRVSAKLRQKTSATDDRLSSKSMGVVGGLVILVVAGSVVTMDLITINARRSGKRNKSEKRKSSNTSSVSAETSITTSAISADVPNHRRYSSVSTTIANSFHIGFDELNLRNCHNNIIPNILPVSAMSNSEFSVVNNKTITNTTRSNSFTSTKNGMTLQCQLTTIPEPRHSRSRSFTCLRQSHNNNNSNNNDNNNNNNTEVGLSVLQLRPEKGAGLTRTPDVVPDIIVTCGENK